MKAQLDIAIGLVLYRAQVLVGWREAKQHQGNKYEFPGGKVEAHETASQACRREVLEEVGIDIAQWYFIDLIHHEYEDLIVNLHVFSGHIDIHQLDQIQQPWTWYRRQDLAGLNFPKANQSLLQNLQWPTQIKISDDVQQLSQLTTSTLCYWRICSDEFQLEKLMEYSVEQCKKLLLNIDYWHQLPDLYKQYIQTIHLKQHQLAYLSAEKRQLSKRYIVACHDEQEIQRALAHGCDAILLSPIQPTATHPTQVALGWEKLAQWAKNCPVPVFALGGLHSKDLAYAQQQGAYGIAGIRFIDA